MFKFQGYVVLKTSKGYEIRELDIDQSRIKNKMKLSEYNKMQSDILAWNTSVYRAYTRQACINWLAKNSNYNDINQDIPVNARLSSNDQIDYYKDNEFGTVDNKLLPAKTAKVAKSKLNKSTKLKVLSNKLSKFDGIKSCQLDEIDINIVSNYLSIESESIKKLVETIKIRLPEDRKSKALAYILGYWSTFKQNTGKFIKIGLVYQDNNSIGILLKCMDDKILYKLPVVI